MKGVERDWMLWKMNYVLNTLRDMEIGAGWLHGRKEENIIVWHSY